MARDHRSVLGDEADSTGVGVDHVLVAVVELELAFDEVLRRIPTEVADVRVGVGIEVHTHALEALHVRVHDEEPPLHVPPSGAPGVIALAPTLEADGRVPTFWWPRTLLGCS